MDRGSYIPLVLGAVLSPFMLGVINRTKAVFAGRKGQPLLQLYFDLWKLLNKGAVYSRTTTWVFRAGPMLGLSATLAALLVTPLGGVPACVSFQGDLVLFALLLGIVRFMLILGALDTGSAFEGMGASREATFSALVEPALFLALASLARYSGVLSLTGIYAAINATAWAQAGPGFALALIALVAVFLVENARIPVDDPNTHLELTMIHEVLVLDHGGPDLAFIQYTAALKHWILGALVAGIAVPVRTGHVVVDGLVTVAGIGVLAVVVGVIESTMARLRLVRIPQLIVGAAALAVVALTVVGR
jgi:formate hydrogenlyase subunit 4